MSADPKPLNPFLTTLVVLAILGFVLSAVFAGVANAPTTALAEGVGGNGFWCAAGWMLALGTASTLAALTAAAVRWQPPTRAPADAGWSISYPDRPRDPGVSA